MANFQLRFGTLLMSENADFIADVADEAGGWRLRVSEGTIDPESLQDLLLLVTYSVGQP
jgi:hypothetical protein